MLDHLPIELLSHVVGLGAPIDYTPSFYLKCCWFLRSVCLVSTHMRDVAQPMLVEVSVVKWKEDAEQLGEDDKNGRAKASQVKLLVLEQTYYRSWVPVPSLFVQCMNVVALRLIDMGQFDLDWLAPLSKLRHFICRGELTFLHPPTNTIFLNLVKLSLCANPVDVALFTDFPRARFFSQLEVLVFDMANHWSKSMYTMSASSTVVDCHISSVAAKFSSATELPPVLRLYHSKPGETLSQHTVYRDAESMMTILSSADSAAPSSVRILIPSTSGPLSPRRQPSRVLSRLYKHWVPSLTRQS
ncbi:hypothetical protein JCM8547_006227 [Rhodosporidiobolus lusitaniae]